MTERVLDQRSGSGTDLAVLIAAHEKLEAELEGLDNHVYLSSEEQFERKRIKKRKLLLKDRIRCLTRSS
jgi:uncharacterized protein YdcH (DUF465 family)